MWVPDPARDGHVGVETRDYKGQGTRFRRGDGSAKMYTMDGERRERRGEIQGETTLGFRKALRQWAIDDRAQT